MCIARICHTRTAVYGSRTHPAVTLSRQLYNTLVVRLTSTCINLCPCATAVVRADVTHHTRTALVGLACHTRTAGTSTALVQYRMALVCLSPVTLVRPRSYGAHITPTRTAVRRWNQHTAAPRRCLAPVTLVWLSYGSRTPRRNLMSCITQRLSIIFSRKPCSCTIWADLASQTRHFAADLPLSSASASSARRTSVAYFASKALSSSAWRSTVA